MNLVVSHPKSYQTTKQSNFHLFSVEGYSTKDESTDENQNYFYKSLIVFSTKNKSILSLKPIPIKCHIDAV